MTRLICVTGGAGYIGVELVKQLVARGDRVRVLDRFFWGSGGLGELPGVELICADVRELDDADLKGVDTVCHLAGLSNDPTADLDPHANWQMNAVATSELAEDACALACAASPSGRAAPYTTALVQTPCSMRTPVSRSAPTQRRSSRRNAAS